MNKPQLLCHDSAPLLCLLCNDGLNSWNHEPIISLFPLCSSFISQEDKSSWYMSTLWLSLPPFLSLFWFGSVSHTCQSLSGSEWAIEKRLGHDGSSPFTANWVTSKWAELEEVGRVGRVLTGFILSPVSLSLPLLPGYHAIRSLLLSPPTCHNGLVLLQA